MTIVDLVRLRPLLDRIPGRPEIKIGLIDGPVVLDHPDLTTENIRELPRELAGGCALSSSAACKHGTFVAGVLLAKRGSAAPAICPGCSLLVRPIFQETNSGNGQMPSATPQQRTLRETAHRINKSMSTEEKKALTGKTQRQQISHSQPLIGPFPHLLCQPCVPDPILGCAKECVSCPGPVPDPRCTSLRLPCPANACCPSAEILRR